MLTANQALTSTSSLPTKIMIRSIRQAVGFFREAPLLPWVACAGHHAHPFITKPDKEVLAMKFGYTIAYVPDVPGSLKFFEVAFGLPTRFLLESGDYGELETGATTLAFASHELGENLAGGHVRASDSSWSRPMCRPLTSGPWRLGRMSWRRHRQGPGARWCPICAVLTGCWWSSARRWARSDGIGHIGLPGNSQACS
jgi:hypothetical protein